MPVVRPQGLLLGQKVGNIETFSTIALGYDQQTDLGRALTHLGNDLGKMPYIMFFGYTGHEVA